MDGCHGSHCTILSPTSGRVVPEIDRSDIREVVLDNYRIVYQLAKHQIIVLNIFESHHLIDRVLAQPPNANSPRE